MAVLLLSSNIDYSTNHRITWDREHAAVKQVASQLIHVHAHKIYATIFCAVLDFLYDCTRPECTYIDFSLASA